MPSSGLLCDFLRHPLISLEPTEKEVCLTKLLKPLRSALSDMPQISQTILCKILPLSSLIPYSLCTRTYMHPRAAKCEWKDINCTSNVILKCLLFLCIRIVFRMTDFRTVWHILHANQSSRINPLYQIIRQLASFPVYGREERWWKALHRLLAFFLLFSGNS